MVVVCFPKLKYLHAGNENIIPISERSYFTRKFSVISSQTTLNAFFNASTPRSKLEKLELCFGRLLFWNDCTKVSLKDCINRELRKKSLNHFFLAELKYFSNIIRYSQGITTNPSNCLIWDTKGTDCLGSTLNRVISHSGRFLSGFTPN